METLEEEKFKIDDFFGHIKEYGEERLRLIVLNLTEKVSRSVSGITAILTISVVILLALIFITSAIAWWIGSEIGQPFTGFFIMGGFYIIVALLLYANRGKWIVTPIINAFLKNLADEEED